VSCAKYLDFGVVARGKALFDLIRDPAYLDVMPYQLASLKVAFVPVHAEVVVPDPRWIVGMVLVTVFLAIGWLRAAADEVVPCVCKARTRRERCCRPACSIIVKLPTASATRGDSREIVCGRSSARS